MKRKTLAQVNPHLRDSGKAARRAGMTEQITVSVDSNVAERYRSASDEERRKLDLLVNLRLRNATTPARAFTRTLNRGAILVSNALVGELTGVLQRGKFDRYVTLRDERTRSGTLTPANAAAAYRQSPPLPSTMRRLPAATAFLPTASLGLDKIEELLSDVRAAAPR